MPIIEIFLCTTLKSSNSDAKVLTVEHLLAAIKGNNIDNLIIEVDSQEIPILDGSAVEYDQIIKNIGIKEQKNHFKKYLIIKEEISVTTSNGFFKIKPCENFQISCSVEFSEPIGKQSVTLGDSFVDVYKNVLDAKTFCYYEDIETMKNNNLAKGGSLENAVVIKEGKVLNSGFKNVNNYFARHKTLDVLGDFSLMDFNIQGNISVYFPGHELNRLAMLAIFSDYANYNIYQYNKSKEFFSQENLLVV